METNTLQVTVPSKIAAFADSAGKFIKSCKHSLSDGFQVGQDVPAIMTSAIQDLLPALQGLKGAGDDLKADPYGSARAIALALVKVAEDFLKPADAQTAQLSNGNQSQSVAANSAAPAGVMSASAGGLVQG